WRTAEHRSAHSVRLSCKNWPSSVATCTRITVTSAGRDGPMEVDTASPLAPCCQMISPIAFSFQATELRAYIRKIPLACLEGKLGGQRGQSALSSSARQQLQLQRASARPVCRPGPSNTTIPRMACSGETALKPGLGRHRRCGEDAQLLEQVEVFESAPVLK